MSKTRWQQKPIYLLFALALVVLVGILPQSEALAQPPQYWAKAYGGNWSDYAYSVQQTSGGGYIVAGETISFGPGGSDFWVLKLASNGNVTWQKAYGGNWSDSANSIQQTSDGGYIVPGIQECMDPGLLTCGY